MRMTRRGFLATAALSMASTGFGKTVRKTEKRIVFIAGADSHKYGEHEHWAGCKLLADRLNALDGVSAEVIKDKWPESDAVFENADAVVLFSDGLEFSVTDGHEESFKKLVDSKVGIGIMHYALFPPKTQYKAYMGATGGFFQPNWSVNPIWQPTFEELPKHAVTNGVGPFSVNDEWYYHMRFASEMKNVIPVLSDLPPAESLIRPDGPYSNNTHVRKDVFAKKEPQHMAWVYERSNSARGFGFTGGHFHWNWAQDDYRKLMLNLVGWAAGVEIPTNGIASKTPTYEELTKPLKQDPANTDLGAIKKLVESFNK